MPRKPAAATTSALKNSRSISNSKLVSFNLSSSDEHFKISGTSHIGILLSLKNDLPDHSNGPLNLSAVTAQSIVNMLDATFGARKLK